ncbi:STM3941 family protein [Mucilaginibacter sp. BT774]|uniref:STM3941 family protein n=1 Tax=Mucilaginibacter sp. BT774 TaxID=3062276 RepID=UPI00267697B9|nr:STM3941 family protein [Mucilaginibacter sp. BT774]MDO3626352.1 STM3941 family protein [Mucilaginibacter sp. BT774]
MIKVDQIEIPLSKNKLALLLIGSTAFVLAGIWFITNPKSLSTEYNHKSPELVFAFGVASILFFGLCAFLILRKMFDNKPGLIINDSGINDNSSGTSVGFIPWKDIEAVRKSVVVNQSMIMVVVNNPEEYINKQTRLITKKAMQINYKSFGSPIFISANGLKCDFNELYDSINSRFHTQNAKK